MVDEDPRADDAIFPVAGMWVELDADDRVVLEGHPDRARLARLMVDLVAAVDAGPGGFIVGSWMVCRTGLSGWLSVSSCTRSRACSSR